MNDLISRQAAIAETEWNMSESPSITRDDWRAIIEGLKELPSAQLEIVRCKNCKHNQLPSTSGNANCEIYYGMTDREGFCHMAERRTDE